MEFFTWISGFFAAMSPIGGGRNELDARFLSLCSIFSLPSPSDETIRHIFCSILSGHTKSFTQDIQSAVKNIMDMTIHLYKVCMFLYTIFKYFIFMQDNLSV